MDFTNLLASMAFSDNAWRCVTPESWMQGRTTYGGLSSTLCLQAVLRSEEALPPLRSAQISFVGPVGGEVAVTPTLLRRGRNVAFVNADLVGEKGLAVRAVFCFGQSRESRFDEDHVAMPAAPKPEDCEVFIPEGMGPKFASYFEQRLARGARPVTASEESDHFLWIRHRDKAASGMTAMLALADMPPPAILSKFPEPAPTSSMTWLVNFLVDDPQTDEGWWLMQTRAEHAREGYSSQDMLVWNASGQPVIAGRQSVALFL